MNQLHAAPSESLVDKIDNMHMKFEDQQTMIHTTQKRVEELYEMVRNQDKRIMKFSSFEQTMNAKMDMVLDTLEIIRQDGMRSPTDTRDNHDGNGGSGGGGRPNDNDGAPVVGLSLADREKNRKMHDTVEEVSKLISEFDKELKALKSSI